VYRTLALLVQAGFLREIRDADTHVHYESVFVREDHEHMICDRCGCFIEFQDTGLAKRVEKACRHRNFQPRSIRVAVFGLCPTCQADVE
jgi:Fur family ferric uptake transcriptional regulator